MENKSQAGKGDKPRNCFSQKYRDNYDSINWGKKENTKIISMNDEQSHAALLGIPIQDYSICYDENGIEINYE
jgi:hypothetical protein